MIESLEPRALLTALSWYKLDEVAGTTAADATGNGHDGTLTGGAWAAGQVDGAIEFNADGNISIPAGVFAAVDQQVSFAFWAYGGDTQPADDSILYGVNADGDRVFNIHLSFSNDRVYWDAGEDAGYDRINKVADPALHKDSWHHWAFTKNAGTGIMKIYLDGEEWASGTGKTRSMAGVTSFTLGAHTNGSSSYDGLLDDVRIFDTELTAGEVLDLFTTTSTGEHVTIDGVPAIGQTLTASHALIGLGTISYQWQRNGGNIAGATAGSYTLGAADDNTLITVVASYTNGGGSSESITSSPVGPVNNFTANSLSDLRAAGLVVNNSTVSLSITDGDPHPVTGIVTPGEYWINGDHYTDPANSHPIFLELSGSGNTYDLTGTTIRLDTRKLDGFGRALGHDSGVDVVTVSGSNNLVKNLTLIGEDIALDTDPGAQRFADWSAQYVELSGDDNTMDGVNVVTRGSRTDAYGLGDAFGKGSAGGVQPFLAHRKANAFRVGEATNAVINNMHLDVNTFGHGFFVQTSTNTTLTNSTVTGELFPSTNVINHPLYQQYGYTFHQNEIPDDILISGSEGGVRMYTGSSGLTVENVVVTNMRTGFATSLGGGTKTLKNVEAYGVESAFGIGNETTVTNAKADGINGPLLVFDRSDIRDTTVEIELVGDQPFNHDYALVYANGNNVDVTITSDRPAEDFEGTTLFRTAQFFFDNWRENNNTTTFDVADYDHINSTLINDTNMILVLGEQATGNTGRSLGQVITNGKENNYDGVSLVPAGKRTVVVHTAGLGNNGTTADGSLETNASIVADGGTLEIQSGIRVTDEKLTITGDGVDGKGALYSDGSSDSNTRFGSSNGGDETTIFLDGDASIGVGVDGNQLLVGRIQGTGNLTKRGAGSLTMGKSSTFDGNLIVAEGHITGRTGVVHRDLTVATGASISAIGSNTFNTQGDVIVDGQLDLNGRIDNNTLSGRIGGLLGSGQVTSSNPFAGAAASLEVRPASGEAVFDGQIATAVSLIKSNTGAQILSGNNTYTGTTAVNGGLLQIDGTHTGGDDYTINANGVLGGNGTIDATVLVNANGHLSPGTSAGTLSVDDVTLTSGAFFDVELGGTAAGSEYDQLLTDSVTLGGLLVISLVESGGETYKPSPADSFTVLTSATSLSGSFENVVSGERVATIGGEGTFLVTYGGQRTVVLSDFAEGDLVATAFDAIPDHVLNGQTDVTFTVANTATVSTGAFFTHVIWSPNDVLGDQDDVVVPNSAASFAGLSAGASESKTISLQLDQAALYAHALASDAPGQPAGTISTDTSRLFLVIDTNNDVIESDETNNSGVGHLTDSDDITYFHGDKNANGVIEPLEALWSIQAIGTNDPASDGNGDGIVSPFEALAVVERISYMRASVVSKSQKSTLSPAKKSFDAPLREFVEPMAALKGSSPLPLGILPDESDHDALFVDFGDSFAPLQLVVDDQANADAEPPDRVDWIDII